MTIVRILIQFLSMWLKFTILDELTAGKIAPTELTSEVDKHDTLIWNSMNLPQCLNLGPKVYAKGLVKFSFSLPELKFLKNGYFLKGVKVMIFLFVEMVKHLLYKMI